jgi:formamidopyrimidine-DNA glycosylase
VVVLQSPGYVFLLASIDCVTLIERPNLQTKMPELPEVETVVRGLRSSLPGRQIVEVRFGKTDFVESPQAIAERLPGMRVADVTRMGKFICILLEPAPSRTALPSRFCLIVHLGMTGRLTVIPSAESVLPHTHVFFVLDDGRELRYTDIRRFGRILVVPESGLAEFSRDLGREPLEISAEEFCCEFESRRARIKALLLDQSVLRGVGNIYADESLFRARLHPARIAGNLTKKQLLALHGTVQKVLEEAIRSRGSTISNYVDSEGNRGSFQFRHRVYQRDGKPCFRCKSIIRRIIVAGRSSHYCPRCQPAPRKRTGSVKKLKPRMHTDGHG